MRDWIVAILVGVLVIMAITVGAFLSVLLTPLAMFVVIVFGIWCLLQLLRENDNNDDGGNSNGGSGP